MAARLEGHCELVPQLTINPTSESKAPLHSSTATPLAESESAKFGKPFIFFFQAEDGIRDYKVTGVQTCALPICGLGSARLRRIKELVHVKMEDDLSLDEMAQSVGLSTAHFGRMFRKSTGETPHQFVLRQKIERAKAMLRAPDARILDVAVACGFKTQQHFAQGFRDVWGVSPTEHRQAFLRSEVTGASETCSEDAVLVVT